MDNATPSNAEPRTPADRIRESGPADTSTEQLEERQLWEGGYSPKAMAGTWIAFGCVALALIMATISIGALRTSGIVWLVILSLIVIGGAVIFLLIVYRKMSHRYVLTTQRFKHRAGILTRVNDRIELIDIDDVSYKQGPIQALMGVGNIYIRSSDSSHPQLTLVGIEHVRRISDQIDDARRAERIKRSIHIEAV